MKKVFFLFQIIIIFISCKTLNEKNIKDNNSIVIGTINNVKYKSSGFHHITYSKSKNKIEIYVSNNYIDYRKLKNVWNISINGNEIGEYILDNTTPPKYAVTYTINLINNYQSGSNNLTIKITKLNLIKNGIIEGNFYDSLSFYKNSSIVSHNNIIQDGYFKVFIDEIID